MSYGKLPGIPRGRLRSHADDEPIPERVYEVLHGFDARLDDFDDRIGGLEDHAREAKQGQATILGKLEDIKATDRHAFTKLVAALVTTAITVIGGQRLLAPSPTAAQPPPAIVRSALDIRLDTCRPMPPGPSREECFARVTAATEH